MLNVFYFNSLLDLLLAINSEGALAESMKAAQASKGKFLYFLQVMEQAEGRDCPYCAAQCVDKCHNEAAEKICSSTNHLIGHFKLFDFVSGL